jgi:hypothetical protein
MNNHDAIMIRVDDRLMSHHWHSASDALEAGDRRAWRVIILGPPLGGPSVSNHDVIMMQS